MNQQISLGVIGAGTMGAHHVRLYSEIKHVKAVYVYDIDQQRAQALAQEYGVTYVNSLEELLAKSDAVSITTSTQSHYEIGSFCLSQKKPCLIEKPLALKSDECDKLVSLSHEKNTTLMVGHVEHFNPAFVELKRIIHGGVKIYSIEARRLSYASSRMGPNVDVIFDLMIHDIELVLALLGSQITKLSALSISGEDPLGHVIALMQDENEVSINLTASRVTQNKVRTLTVTSDVGWFYLDFLRQELMLYQSASSEITNRSFGSKVTLDIDMKRIFIRNQEPLILELKHFVDCVLNGSKVQVTGEVGRDSVRIADRIKQSLSIK
jgi:predicted dehydrogenase